jgi:hypothetical protein
MANPLVNQGQLNRLRASIQVPAAPILNITSSFLSKRGITLSFEGQSTVYLDTMTGAVISPEPYLKASVTVYLVKTLPPAAAYKAQLELLSAIGDISLITDATSFPNYDLANCSIMANPEQSFAGDQPDYAVTLGGLYYINSSLFDQA